MSGNVLPDAFIVLLVYGLLQLGKSVLPQSATWPNNVMRAIGYALTYVMVVINRLVSGPVHWPDLWGLLPLAAALYGGSALLFHVQDNKEGGNVQAPSVAAAAPDTQTQRGSTGLPMPPLD